MGDRLVDTARAEYKPQTKGFEVQKFMHVGVVLATLA
jgi:hypothetical protein